MYWGLFLLTYHMEPSNHKREAMRKDAEALWSDILKVVEKLQFASATNSVSSRSSLRTVRIAMPAVSLNWGMVRKSR